jgi:hypothetical protein
MAYKRQMIDRPASQTFQNHCFLVSSKRDNGNSMYIEEYDGSGHKVALQLMKAEYRDKDDDFWKALAVPPPIEAAAMVDIKWKELYDKWGKYIP